MKTENEIKRNKTKCLMSDEDFKSKSLMKILNRNVTFKNSLISFNNNYDNRNMEIL